MPYDKGGSQSIIDYKVRYVQEINQFAAGTPEGKKQVWSSKQRNLLKNVERVK